MKLSNRRKLLMVLCVVGLAALVADRLRQGSSSEPESAAASVAGPTESPTPTGKAVQASTGNLSTWAGKAISQRLATATGNRPLELADMKDVFQPWDNAPVLVNPTDVVKDPEGTSVAAFTSRHSLQAVLVGADGRQAVIDGKVLKVGQRLDGFELVNVGERSVLLVSVRGTKVTFELPHSD